MRGFSFCRPPVKGGSEPQVSAGFCFLFSFPSLPKTNPPLTSFASPLDRGAAKNSIRT
jgi:hypothetical protein